MEYEQEMVDDFVRLLRHQLGAADAARGTGRQVLPFASDFILRGVRRYDAGELVGRLRGFYTALGYTQGALLPPYGPGENFVSWLMYKEDSKNYCATLFRSVSAYDSVVVDLARADLEFFVRDNFDTDEIVKEKLRSR